MTVLLIPILKATRCVLLSTWPEIGDFFRSARSGKRRLPLRPYQSNSFALDSTPAKPSENAIKIVVSGNFAAYIRLQLIMLGL
jgi:hypothetical protein